MFKVKAKYIGIISLSILIIISIIYTGNKNVFSSETLDKELTICTSLYPMHIMALNITTDLPDARLVSVTTPETGCLNDIQLSVTDMKTLDKSDIFIINGAGMEDYLEKVASTFPDLLVIDASKNINLKEVTPSHEQHHGSEDHDDHNHDINPHVWVSISLAIQQVQSIGEQLAHLDQANKDLYLKNTESYISKLEKLKDRMHRELSDLKYRDIITIHDAFPYLAQEFDLNILAVVQRESDSEPSARELAETIDLVRKNEVRCIFVEPQFPDLAAKTIARETGAKVYTLNPASSGPLQNNAYLDIMENNLQILKEALAE